MREVVIIMRSIVVCCETIRDELTMAMKEIGCDYPVIWIESGLHNFPNRLKDRLQETLDSVNGFERVLMGFGFCGNAVVGLCAGDFELVLPRVDDCITMLLGSVSQKNQNERTYFLTKGWLDGERNIWWEYQYTINKYGLELGKEIYTAVLAGYRNLGILDTGAYDIDTLCSRTELIAHELGLEHKILPASTTYLSKLLTGPWPDNGFLTIRPYQEIRSDQLTLGDD